MKRHGTLPGRAREALVVAGLGVAFGVLQATMLYLGLKQEKDLPFEVSFPRILAWQVLSWLVWGVLAPAILALGARVTPERPLRWLAVHLPAAAAAATVHAAAATAADAAFHPFGQGPEGSPLTAVIGRLTSSFHFEVLIYFAILGASYAFDYHRRFRDRELRAAQLEGRLAEARLEALRLQLQPHFLFNALHTVAGLVRQGENPAAVDMLARLSDLLRATLDGGGRPLVPLREELALAERYLAIQQVRFADRLRVERAVDPALLAAAVPPFVLQPLLENAIRHGLGVRAGAGALHLAAERAGEDLRLEVQDDGQGLAAAGGSAVEGVGLGNTRARLAQLFGDTARLELLPRPGGGAIARLTLPLIPMTGEGTA
jgi:two-component system LytT family sensor kinase